MRTGSLRSNEIRRELEQSTPRTHSAKKKRKNSSKKTIFFLLFLLLCIFLMIGIYLLFHISTNTIQMNTAIMKNRDLGKQTFLTEQNAKANIDIQYPTLSSPNIDQTIQEYLHSLRTGFEKTVEKDNISYPTLSVTYRSYRLTKNTGVVIFDIAEKEKKWIQVYHLDLANDSILTKNAIFKENVEEKLTELIKSKVETNTSLKPYLDGIDTNHYILDTNHVIFYLQSDESSFDFNHIPKVTFTYKELKNMLQDQLEVPTQILHMVYTKQEIEVSKQVPKEVKPVATNKPMIALTFDDGPHITYTTEILNALKKYGGAATFFVVGSRASQYPQILQNIVAQGSEIGNHTWSHKNLANLSITGIQKEVNDTTDMILKSTNVKPKLIRPPYGSINTTVKNTVSSPLILWNVDTLDWKTKNKDMIVQEALKNAKDGNIILMHDIYATSKDAALTIIEELSKKGFQLVTVSQMYQSKKVPFASGKAYTNL